MASVISAVTAVFNWLFVGTTGANATDPAIKTVIDLITGNDFLLVGVALMITGAAVSYLSRLIRY